MNVLRNKTVMHSRKGIRKKFSFSRAKLLFILLLGIIIYIIINKQYYLDQLDNKPISGFALLSSNEFTTYDDVKDKLLKMGTLKGFFTQDVNIIKEQIKTIPWVKDVVVRKIWPDRLSIWLSEYEPVAVWNDISAVSKEGEIFRLPPDRLKKNNLPRLSGPNYQSMLVLESWEYINNYLKKQDIKLKELGIDERGSWQATLDNDVILKLGRGKWNDKLDRFVTIYPQIEIPENKRLFYIDLRYSIGASVGLIDVN
ncbi:cell division protein FtsQ [Bisgaardia hudsonensis]|uniref:Cell division protein FtsQ n=1 Tax=Bisgaardia hudsonensis TaxID=109472 RepID=A0A4R2N048_9PAST|nr:cell division protein FtsQ/DivIB [Bisgaardia hudsonensis]QLB13361.1 cell division protein FtsQ [Bisgaardia hudsonensis]TCP12762.1 cell division protein FtsQ [Bisgaardia hudsonensis]